MARLLFVGQAGRTPQLLEPSLSPGGQLAFAELRPVGPSLACGANYVTCSSASTSSALLTEAWVGVASSVDALNWRTLDTLSFPGGSIRTNERIDALNVFETSYHPAQIAWLTRRALPLKPSWSPDGRYLLSADHEGIHLVDTEAEAGFLLIAGDVGNPAWSPDGAWIAFDRVERTDTVVDMCLYTRFDPAKPNPEPQCWERRIFHRTTPPTVMVSSVDGSDLVDIGPGSDPIWHPGGDYLFFVGPASILRRDMVTGSVEVVPGTEGGLEPAVSPDARWLAFSRFDSTTSGHDVWVTSITAD